MVVLNAGLSAIADSTECAMVTRILAFKLRSSESGGGRRHRPPFGTSRFWPGGRRIEISRTAKVSYALRRSSPKAILHFAIRIGNAQPMIGVVRPHVVIAQLAAMKIMEAVAMQKVIIDD